MRPRSERGAHHKSGRRPWMSVLRRHAVWTSVAVVAVLLAAAPLLLATSAVDWHFNGTVIEACSCPMFCQCYFNTEPAAHAGHGGSGSLLQVQHGVPRSTRAHHGDTESRPASNSGSPETWAAEFHDGDHGMGRGDVRPLGHTDAAEAPGSRTVLGSYVPRRSGSRSSVAEDAEISVEGQTRNGAVGQVGRRSQAGRGRPGQQVCTGTAVRRRRAHQQSSPTGVHRGTTVSC